MTHSGTSVAHGAPTWPRELGAGCSGVDPAGTPGRCRARRRSHPGHHGSRWCRCVQSSARSGQPPVSIQTFGPLRTRCAGAGNGSHWRTAKATRYRRLSYADNRTAITSSTGATGFPSRERCSTTTSMRGSQALGDSTQQPAQPFAKRSPPDPLKRRCSLGSANVERQLAAVRTIASTTQASGVLRPDWRHSVSCQGRPRRRPTDRSQTRGVVLPEAATLPRLAGSGNATAGGAAAALVLATSACNIRALG